MKKKKPFIRRRPILTGVLIVLAYLLYVLWPLRGFLLHPSWWWGRHLVIFTNEAEARPCGGFVTAVGEFSLLPPRLVLKNSYHFAGPSFGKLPKPLDKVAQKLSFWDLGYDTNPIECQQRFGEAYQAITGVEPTQVWLASTGMLEEALEILGSFEVGDETVDADNAFAVLSRSVADVDRHNEEVLENRKAPLATLGKKMMGRAIWQVWKWPRLTRFMRSQLDRGVIFQEDYSPALSEDRQAITLTEWNLGGGKSSRGLTKHLKLRFREYEPGVWEGLLELQVEHWGGYDQPISQDYTGMIEIGMPDFLGGETLWFDIGLKPKEIYGKTLRFHHFILPESIPIAVPRGQAWAVDTVVSFLPQQRALGGSENQIKVFETMEYPGKTLDLRKEADTEPPFVTLHEPLPSQAWANFDLALLDETVMVVEVHFNEKVSIDREGFVAEIRDTDYKDPDTGIFEAIDEVLLEDQRTMLVAFSGSQVQSRERYALTIGGVRDLWGNEMEEREGWTVISP